jgi:hypothetical protein
VLQVSSISITIKLLVFTDEFTALDCLD